VPRRKIHYGPIDPVLSRELFIRGALVAGEYDTRAPWFAHNRALIKEIEELEHKARKSGVWLDEERIFRVFDARIPADLHNGAAFEQWRAEAEAANPNILFLQREDILGEGLGATTRCFPRRWRSTAWHASSVPLRARHALDGVTLHCRCTCSTASSRRRSTGWCRPHSRKTHPAPEVAAKDKRRR